MTVIFVRGIRSGHHGHQHMAVESWKAQLWHAENHKDAIKGIRKIWKMRLMRLMRPTEIRQHPGKSRKQIEFSRVIEMYSAVLVFTRYEDCTGGLQQRRGSVPWILIWGLGPWVGMLGARQSTWVMRGEFTLVSTCFNMFQHVSTCFTVSPCVNMFQFRVSMYLWQIIAIYDTSIDLNVSPTSSFGRSVWRTSYRRTSDWSVAWLVSSRSCWSNRISMEHCTAAREAYKHFELRWTQ